MTSSLPLDLEMENFGWSEEPINSNLLESYNSSVDDTMSFAIFLLIYIYCLIELFFEFIINDLSLKVVIPRISLLNLSDVIVLPRLTTK